MNKGGISSSRVVVRPYVSWQSRLLILLVVCLFLTLLSWGMFEIGKGMAERGMAEQNNVSPQKISGEPYKVEACLQNNRKSLCAQLADLTRQLQIVQTTSNALAEQARELGRENNQLKEELDFFEHVVAGNTKIDSGISIHHFNLKNDDNPGVYRYTVSLVQGGQRPKEFNGNLKFFVNLRQNEQTKTVLLTNKNKKQNFPISFKFFHRLEESFKVPPDTKVDSIKVQVFEQNDTQVKLTQTVELTL